MLKFKRRRLLVIAIIVLLIVLAVALINFYPLIFMKPIDTGKIPSTEVFVIKDWVANVYTIQSSEGYILIDAGFNAKTIKKTLEQENILPEDIKHIFLTHSDDDHVAAVELFPNASVYMSQDELQMVNGEIQQGKNNSKSKLNDIGLENIILLTDNQYITIGEYMIKCISAPGHTTGCMAYVVNEKYLFSGDCFRVNNSKLSVHPFTRDEQLCQDSIKKLYEVIGDTEYTFTSHYGYHVSSNLIND